jgi:hypothetical protein
LPAERGITSAQPLLGTSLQNDKLLSGLVPLDLGALTETLNITDFDPNLPLGLDVNEAGGANVEVDLPGGSSIDVHIDGPPVEAPAPTEEPTEGPAEEPSPARNSLE